MAEKGVMEELAIERTLLAQERTNLSYIRTGISLALGGLFFTGYFAPGTLYFYIGYLTIFVSIVFTLYGFYHHQKSRALVSSIIGISFGKTRLKEDRSYHWGKKKA